MAVRDLQRKPVLLGAVLVGLILSIPVTYTYFGRAGLQAVSIAASSFLTFALVVLYDRQHRALRSQQEPQLEVSGIELYDDFELVNLDVSNFGGGPATSMGLRIGLYELSGDGPIRTVEGQLRRIEPLGENVQEKTMASSLKPSELSIEFEAESRSVLPMGGSAQRQKSLLRILREEFDKDRDVIYGKLVITYATNFADGNESVADFSLKFTDHDGIDYELMDFLPWQDENVRTELGG